MLSLALLAPLLTQMNGSPDTAPPPFLNAPDEIADKKSVSCGSKSLSIRFVSKLMGDGEQGREYSSRLTEIYIDGREVDRSSIDLVGKFGPYAGKITEISAICVGVKSARFRVQFSTYDRHKTIAVFVAENHVRVGQGREFGS